MVWDMMKTLLVWLLSNVLVFTTCIQHKADPVILQVLLLPCRFSNLILAVFPLFIKSPPRGHIFFLFLLYSIVGLLTNALQNPALICRMC